MSNETDAKSVGAEALKDLRGEKKEEVPEASAPEAPEKEEELSPEEVAEIMEKKIARMTQVLSRGILNDQLLRITEAGTPPGRIGKLVRNTEEDVIRYQNLGFTFDVKDGARGLHASGDGRVTVGDLVLMTISREDWEVLQIIRKRRILQNVGGAAQKEYKAKMEELGAAPVFDESVTHIGKGVR